MILSLRSDLHSSFVITAGFPAAVVSRIYSGIQSKCEVNRPLDRFIRASSVATEQAMHFQQHILLIAIVFLITDIV